MLLIQSADSWLFVPASRASGVYDGDLDLHVQSPDDLVAQLAKVEYEA